METYRLKSRLVENNKEYVIQTSNDTNLSTVSSVIYINGEEAETIRCPLPMEVSSEEILSLVKLRHGEMKRELESLLEAYRRVLGGSDPQKMYHLGTAFFYKQFYLESRQLFMAATKADSQFHQAFNYLGLAESALGHHEEAVRACRIAVEKRPGYADYRNNLGEALLSTSACKPAIDEFEEAIRINLYYGDAHFNLGLALILNGLEQQDTKPVSYTHLTLPTN